jgi:hypothetical protein
VTLGSVRVCVREGGGGGLAGERACRRMSARCGGVGGIGGGGQCCASAVGAHHGAEQELPVEADDPAAAGVVLGARLQLVAQLAAPEPAAAEETSATTTAAAAGVGERATGRAALPGVPDVPRAAQRAARTLRRPLLQQGRYVVLLARSLARFHSLNSLEKFSPKTYFQNTRFLDLLILRYAFNYLQKFTFDLTTRKCRDVFLKVKLFN